MNATIVTVAEAAVAPIRRTERVRRRHFEIAYEFTAVNIVNDRKQALCMREPRRNRPHPWRPRLKITSASFRKPDRQVLTRDAWHCQNCRAV